MKRASAEADPFWYQNAVFYEVPVKSFFDGNSDGFGDFPGLTRKLDYLQELGVTCVWLLPFSPSPLRDDGYDVSDYRDVHPAYGTLLDFQAFVQEAHQRGLRVAAEMVVNHTSIQHPWFQAARAAPPRSPLRDFYLWSDTDTSFAEADVLYGDVKRSNWTCDPAARAYYYHRFFHHQPDLNYDNPQVRGEMLKVLRFWLDQGVDGLCLNGVSYLFKREGTRCEHLSQTHPALKEIRRELEAAYPQQPLPVVRGPATSSNSLLFYGQRLLLKLFRRLQPGINPDFEIGRFLTEKNTFDRIPRVAGSIEYRRQGSEPITLAILQALVHNQGDGWRHAVDELGRYYERASGRMSAPDPVAPDNRSLLELSASAPPPGALEAIGAYLHAAGTLGRRTAEMHLALADANDPDFAPEPFAPADAARLRESIREQGRKALATLRDNWEKLPEEVAPSARRLLDEGPGVLERLNQESPVHPDADKIRCHGDYHLGQVLRVENDFVILDFEGEPTRTVEERRAKQSPLKDVAGMVRSYHYAAYAGLFAFTQNDPDVFGRLEPWAELWFQWVSAAFLREYRAAAEGAAFLPSDPAPLLDAFMLDKAFYELNYELNNRPDWVRIPLRGILALLDEGRVAGPTVKGSTP